ncbi:histidine phosphatase family protein [Roseicella aquatilis]|uniref:Histidine phosphatase family protein n=1 Tax=Roseicella aquatilis TaxID=2527868 RepID=A0A4R4DH60_9PROT|nr:histidine phosphatase family protein [Roseicella aquatilis]TCZ59888.1 histidine phosphatase family protein [Roseicella aquatilis]
MILLRHGQSEFNLHFHKTGRDPGIPDAPLTPLGQMQAAAAAEVLAREDIRRILCSPYTRALQTAAPVARALGLPVTVTPVVRERYSASCDIGSRRAALARAWPALDFAQIEEVWWPDCEEPHESFESRAALFRAEAAALPDRAHTLVVCHWGFIRALSGRDVGNGEWLRLPR